MMTNAPASTTSGIEKGRSRETAPSSDPSRASDRAIFPPISGPVIAWVILRRELVRFVRQPARIVAAVGTPLMIWVFMGSGFASAYRSPVVESGAGGGVSAAAAPSYALFLLPGMMTLVAMFTAIFSCISIIEDRREGWLQSALVSPAPRWSIAAGKMAGGTTVAWAQAMALLLGAPLLGASLSAGGALFAGLAILLTAIGMTGVGVAFAWRSESTQGFHAVMNLVLMPMWLLSGAFFAPEQAAPWLEAIMLVNPLTWSTAALRDSLFGAEGEARLVPFIVSGGFAIGAFGIATLVVATRRKGALTS